MDILKTIERLGKQENAITDQVIVSPVFYNRRIITRIEKILYYLDIPFTEPGWYNFKPVDKTKAKILSVADIQEKQNYLKQLHKTRVILVYKKNNMYFGVPLKGTGFDISTLLPIYLCDDTVKDFSKCICRFDGLNLWFDSVDISGDLAKTDYLNQSLINNVKPGEIKYKGLTLEEKIAYNIRVELEIKQKEIEAKLKEKLKKDTIKDDVVFGGGRFIQSTEKSDHFSVTYEVNGHNFTSIISKDPKHHVITAGICLSGKDRDFDLRSLISVISEGQNRNLIYKTLHDHDD